MTTIKKNKILFAIRHGQTSGEFTHSLIEYVKHDKDYDVEYYVSRSGEYEQDTLDMFVEKMKSYSSIVFVSPSVGFTSLAIDKLVSNGNDTVVCGLPVPVGVNQFNGGEMVKESGHAKIMTATFQLASLGSQIKLDKDASIQVSTFQKNDIICIPQEVANKSPDISRGYSNLGNCKMYTEFNTSYMGVTGCLLEQLRHIVKMRGMLVK